MSKENETPEERRERRRQEELKKTSSSIYGSGLPDLVGGLDWKSIGILILVLILVFIIYAVFFRYGRDNRINMCRNRIRL